MRRRLGRRRICRLAGLRIRATGIASRERRRWIFTASGRRFTSTTAIGCSARKSTTRSKTRKEKQNPDPLLRNAKDRAPARAEEKGKEERKEQIPRTASRAPENQGKNKSARDSARDDSLE